MAVTVRKLIELLKTKNPNDEVEFMICRKRDGSVVMIDVEANSVDMQAALSMFGNGSRG